MRNILNIASQGYDGESIINDMLSWSSKVESIEILGLIRILLCQYKSVNRTNKNKEQVFDLLNSMIEKHREHMDKNAF